MNHVVLFRVAGQQYAVSSSSVVEVVALVAARSMPKAPAWVRGWINFRGRLIVLLDCRTLLGGDTQPPSMVNRILVMRTGRLTDDEPELVGLQVDQVLGSAPVDFGEQASPGRFARTTVDYLGVITSVENETVQLLDPSRLPMP